MAFVFTDDFLQEHQVRRRAAYRFTQFRENEASVECGKTLFWTPSHLVSSPYGLSALSAFYFSFVLDPKAHKVLVAQAQAQAHRSLSAFAWGVSLRRSQVKEGGTYDLPPWSFWRVKYRSVAY